MSKNWFTQVEEQVVRDKVGELVKLLGVDYLNPGASENIILGMLADSYTLKMLYERKRLE